jgi:hypothetical protein
MQQDRSSGLRVPLTDVQPAMSAGEQKVNGFHETHEETVNNGAIERAGEPVEDTAHTPLADGEPVSRLGPADCAPSIPTVRVAHPQFRTQVAVGEVMVTGVLPCTARAHAGSIAIGGDVRFLSCDEALELVDALLLVVARMDVAVEERCSMTIDATRDREG